MSDKFDPTVAPPGYHAVMAVDYSCMGCAFDSSSAPCGEDRPCLARERKDGQRVIFKAGTVSVSCEHGAPILDPASHTKKAWCSQCSGWFEPAATATTPSEKLTPSFFYRARVSVLVGDRRICEFMASAGLGVTGVGETKLITIDYADGEEVDAERVMRAIAGMREEADRTQQPFKVLSAQVVGLVKLDASKRGEVP